MNDILFIDVRVSAPKLKRDFLNLFVETFSEPPYCEMLMQDEVANEI